MKLLSQCLKAKVRLLLVDLGKNSFLTRRINSKYLPWSRAKPQPETKVNFESLFKGQKAFPRPTRYNFLYFLKP